MLRRTGKHGRRCKQVQAREQVHEARAAGTACGAIVRTGQPCCGEGRAQTLVVERLGSRFLRRMGEEMWGRTQRVEPRVGGLRWHAMRVGRLLYCGVLKAWAQRRGVAEGLYCATDRETALSHGLAKFERGGNTERVTAHIRRTCYFIVVWLDFDL